MRVREAILSDIEAVRPVHCKSITELGRDEYTQEQVDAWANGCESADYSATIDSEDLLFIVAEADGDVVGFGSLQFDSPDEYEVTVDAEVTGVYVHPAVVRQGVGTHIYADLERQARERDVRTLGLSASLNAVPFYESHGYEQIREYAHEFSSHEATGVEGIVVEMKKTL